MQGIGSGIAQPQSGQPQPDPQGIPPGNEQGGEQASPEEQEQYRQFVLNGMELIYPKGEQAQVSPAILAQLQGQFQPEALQMFEQADPPITPSPTDNLAATTVLVTLMLEGSAAQSGTELSDDVVLHGGKVILEELAEVAETTGIQEYDEKAMEFALYRAMDLYRVSSPRVDPEALSQEFSQFVEADRSGQLDQVLPPGVGAALKGAEGAA